MSFDGLCIQPEILGFLALQSRILLQGSIGLDSSAISLQKFQGLALKPLPREFLCENCDSLLHRVHWVLREKSSEEAEAELEIGRERTNYQGEMDEWTYGKDAKKKPDALTRFFY